MARSGRKARRPPEAMTPAGSSVAAQQSQASGFGTWAALRVIGLAMLGQLLRSRRFYERVAVGAIVLAALARISRENRAGMLARLAAWNKREAQRLERQAERQGRRLVRRAKEPLAARSPQPRSGGRS